MTEGYARVMKFAAADVPLLRHGPSDAREYLWTQVAISILGEHLLAVRGMTVFATDGIKVAASGRKMPTVKTIHPAVPFASRRGAPMPFHRTPDGLPVDAARPFVGLDAPPRPHEVAKVDNLPQVGGLGLGRRSRSRLDSNRGTSFRRPIFISLNLSPRPRPPT